MLDKFFRKNRSKNKDEIVSAVISQTAALIHDLQRQVEFRFNEISAQIKEIESGLVQLETKLLTKDLKDKQAYGLLHYKLHEVKNEKVAEEISDLTDQLTLRKALLEKNQK
jgi:DNA-binding HxlR family transcriptional regulator